MDNGITGKIHNLHKVQYLLLLQRCQH